LCCLYLIVAADRVEITRIIRNASTSLKGEVTGVKENLRQFLLVPRLRPRNSLPRGSCLAQPV
jgi:hypothetical protein